jgi:hypothetical protein
MLGIKDENEKDQILERYCKSNVETFSHEKQIEFANLSRRIMEWDVQSDGMLKITTSFIIPGSFFGLENRVIHIDVHGTDSDVRLYPIKDEKTGRLIFGFRFLLYDKEKRMYGPYHSSI